MKNIVLFLTMALFSAQIATATSDSPMVVKVQPIVLGNYPEPQSFFDAMVAGAGVVIASQANVHFKCLPVQREEWSGYQDLSQEELEDLFYGRGPAWRTNITAKEAIPVFFVDSIRGKQLVGSEFHTAGRNGRVVMALGPVGHTNWFLALAREICVQCGLSESRQANNLMLGEISIENIFLNSSQVQTLRQTLTKNGLGHIQTIEIKWFEDSGGRKLVVCPKGLVEGIDYRWQKSNNLQTWETIDPSVAIPKTGNVLETGSEERMFYRIQILPPYTLSQP